MSVTLFHRLKLLPFYLFKDDEEGDEDDDDEGSDMELDEDFPDINAAPHIRFERFDRDDDLIIEFDNMFSNNGKDFMFFNHSCGIMQHLQISDC